MHLCPDEILSAAGALGAVWLWFRMRVIPRLVYLRVRLRKGGQF